MKKIWCFVFLLLLFSSLLVAAQGQNNSSNLPRVDPRVGQAIDRTAVRTAQKVDSFAERLGLWILKIQEVSMGALSYISLGVMSKGGHLALSQFLLFTLVFMIIYSISSMVPIFSKYGTLFSLIVSFLAIFWLDAAELQAILTTYESLGVAFGVMLPVMVILSFAYKVYAKAHNGKGKTSPFYANLFNAVFMIFFGWFFIKYAAKEEGAVATVRIIAGWFLMIAAIIQFFLFERLANFISAMKFGAIREYRRELRERSTEMQKINSKELRELAQGVKEEEVEMISGDEEMKEGDLWDPESGKIIRKKKK